MKIIDERVMKLRVFYSQQDDSICMEPEDGSKTVDLDLDIHVEDIIAAGQKMMKGQP